MTRLPSVPVARAASSVRAAAQGLTRRMVPTISPISLVEARKAA
ncbi:hypothetical protein NYO98_20880 [Nocardioides sp. STR2]|uniref:Uncharacterized protein n=1 Tax=Nocardioides pini TaxID=2975053 RepID=A0ABT4CIG4_9ACTN|nr:hypothetical protein [Nocardioides pini]MCY4728748.1 hypothetical protein [Nocardioides pini]